MLIMFSMRPMLAVFAVLVTLAAFVMLTMFFAKARKNSCRIVIVAVAILFAAGFGTAAALPGTFRTLQCRIQGKAPSDSTVSQAQGKGLPLDDAEGQSQDKALSGSAEGQSQDKALSDNAEAQARGKVLSGSAEGQSQDKVLSDSTEGKPQDAEPSDGSKGQEDMEKRKVALTFDDGPDPEYTPMLLDGLKERGVKVTFFVIGRQAEAYPELMERIAKEGHLIGNHTYNHVDIRHMTESAAKEEIQKANEVIAKYTGEEPCFLRPPFGSGSKKLEKEVEMIQVLWNIDTMDWACKNEAKICGTVYREIQENSIILMHDEYPASVRAALSIIDRLQEEGYEFVTVDQVVMD